MSPWCSANFKIIVGLVLPFAFGIMSLERLPPALVLYIGGLCDMDTLLALSRTHREIVACRLMRLAMAPLLLRRLGLGKRNISDFPVCFREAPRLFGSLLEEISDVLVYPRRRTRMLFGGKSFSRRCETCIQLTDRVCPFVKLGNGEDWPQSLDWLAKQRHTVERCHEVMRINLVTYLYLRRFRPLLLGLIY